MNSKGLKKDQKNLSKGRNHMCSLCQQGFPQKDDLDQHMLCHSWERLYQCITCSKQFRHRSHLNSHMLSHSREKPYECLTCQKRFIHNGHLNEHLRTHSRQTPFGCSTCSQQFKQKSNLKRHMLMHSREKLYECPTCQKSFNRKGHLTEHLSIHSGKKPFICQTCSKQIRLKCNLIKHMRIHSKKKQDTSGSKQCLQQNSLLTDKSSLERRDLEIVDNEDTEYEIKPSTSKTYFDENVKTEIDADFESYKSNCCFEIPIKQELMSKDQETPSSSYQTLNVKQEPTENADPT